MNDCNLDALDRRSRLGGDAHLVARGNTLRGAFVDEERSHPLWEVCVVDCLTRGEVCRVDVRRVLDRRDREGPDEEAPEPGYRDPFAVHKEDFAKTPRFEQGGGPRWARSLDGDSAPVPARASAADRQTQRSMNDGAAVGDRAHRMANRGCRRDDSEERRLIPASLIDDASRRSDVRRNN